MGQSGDLPAEHVRLRRVLHPDLEHGHVHEQRGVLLRFLSRSKQPVRLLLVPGQLLLRVAIVLLGLLQRERHLQLKLGLLARARSFEGPGRAARDVERDGS